METVKKVSEEQFGYFVAQCKIWSERFGLNHWRIEYKLEDVHKGFAETTVYPSAFRAHITLNDIWDGRIIPLNRNSLSESAKHEMLHVLFSQYECVATERFVSEGEHTEALEKLIVILAKNLPKAKSS